MNKAAVSTTTICTVAIGCISAAGEYAVHAAVSSHIEAVGALASAFALAMGSWLIYLGHCRAMLPQPPAQ